MVGPMVDHVAGIQEQWRRERPDLDVSPLGTIARLHRLADDLREQLVATYADFGLGEGEFDVLATLRRQGEPFELAPGEIARRTMVTSGAASKRIDRLEADGLVERRRGSDDGRRRVIALTNAGRERIDSAFAAHIENEHRLLRSLDADRRVALEELLRHWSEQRGL